MIELAVVIIIVGLLTGAFFQHYKIYLNEQKKTVTRERLVVLNKMMADFRARTGRLPCPAQPKIVPTNTDYGREFDSSYDKRTGKIDDYNLGADDFEDFCDPALVSVAMNTCGINGLCYGRGARDIELVNAPKVPPVPFTPFHPLDGLNEAIIIGSFPFKTVREVVNQDDMEDTANLSDDDAVDGWGNQFSYVVTRSLTNEGQFRYYDGVIRAIDEHGQMTAGIKDDAQYAFVSHGEDGNGAYAQGGGTGGTVAPCVPALGATPKDSENCDNNGTLMQALGVYKANTTDHFDDIVIFGNPQTAVLWIDKDSAGNITNTNAKSIGIKTDTPMEKLDINGTLRADFNVRANEICDNAGNCFDMNIIASNPSAPNKIQCTGNTVMKGISLKKAVCTTPTFAPLTATNCPTGTYVQGFRTNGSVICTAP